MPRVTVIYATPTAIPPIQEELARFPDLEVLTLLDEALLRCALDEGGVLTRSRQRMAAQLELAAASGSSAVLVTCNIYSAALPELRAKLTGVTVLAVDEPMVELVSTRFHRVAVVATGKGGLDTQSELLLRAARDRGRELELVPVLCEEAFAALASGEAELHDRLLLDAMQRLEGQEIEAAVLGQASMARALPLLAGCPYPVLSSPQLAVAELHRLITA